MKRGRILKAVAWVLLILLGGAILLVGWMGRPRGLAYWQKQAVAVSLGMTRAEVQKQLPFDSCTGPLWALENLRAKFLSAVPPLIHAPEFALASSNAWSHQMYELEKGVAVVIRYDRSGSLPGAVPPSTGAGGMQPGDHVVLLPVVTDTASARKLQDEYWRHP